LRFGGWSYGRSFRVISAGSALRALSCVGNETGSPWRGSRRSAPRRPAPPGPHS